VQIGMVLFMFCSVAWAVLIVTDSLQMWHAAVPSRDPWLRRRVLGSAGTGADPRHRRAPQLPSAVRLMATSRLHGPARRPRARAAVPARLRSVYGLCINAALVRAAAALALEGALRPRFRSGEHVAPAHQPRFHRHHRDRARVSSNRIIVSMLLAGTAIAVISNAYQAQMPEFGRDLGHGDPDVSYSALWAPMRRRADRGPRARKPRPASAQSSHRVHSRDAWCCRVASFAISSSYSLALVLLFAAGFLELSF
jgi:hypothetical protein